MSDELNAVRLAYGLLWHSKTDQWVVHEARRVLLYWLNDGDQQKIGIEEARIHMNFKPDFIENSNLGIKQP